MAGVGGWEGKETEDQKAEGAGEEGRGAHRGSRSLLLAGLTADSGHCLTGCGK